MPNPTAAPPPAARALPADLDQLVREALAGGGVGKLKAAMLARGGPASPAPASPPPAAPRSAALPVARPSPVPRPPAPAWPRPAPALAVDPPAGPPPGGPGPDPVAALGAALATLQGALGPGQGPAARAALARLREACDAVEQAIPVLCAAPAAPAPAAAPAVAPAGPAPVAAAGPVVLPPYRQPWLLAVEGPGDGDRTAALAAALATDRITARLVALARHPKVALRGDDGAALAAAADRVRAQLGLKARALRRTELAGIDHPQTVLAVHGLGPLRVAACAVPAWDCDPAEARSLPAGVLPGADVQLVVFGEVVTRLYRDGQSLGRGRRGQRVLRPAGERRRRVVDLHGPGCFLRLVQGVTDTSGLPGHVPGSALQSFKQLEEAPHAAFGAVPCTASRSCSPGAAPALPAEAEPGQPIAVSGWPDWEEHSRVCRLLGGLGPVTA